MESGEPVPGRRVAHLGWALALLLTLAGSARADVFFLRNGDRITGKTVSAGRRAFVVQTPFGRLTIPRARIHKRQRADGTEEVLNPVEAPSPPPPAPEPPVARARLVIAVTGKTFWQAWDPKQEADPTLRFEVWLDEETIVVYQDAQADLGEIQGAVVNSFSFAAPDVSMAPAPGVLVSPPEARPGRVVLKLELPSGAAGAHTLRLAYQLNDGTATEPAWRDAASASAPVRLSLETPVLLEVRQERGRMEFGGFSRRRMKNVETFKLSILGNSGG